MVNTQNIKEALSLDYVISLNINVQNQNYNEWKVYLIKNKQRCLRNTMQTK